MCQGGTYGPNWAALVASLDGVSTFADVANAQGFDASEACCECGIATTSFCGGSDRNWVTDDGETCKSLVEGYVCQTGVAGPGSGGRDINDTIYHLLYYPLVSIILSSILSSRLSYPLFSHYHRWA